ncbi:MAG: TRAP transporter permease, partial [Bauldia litoralis]
MPVERSHPPSDASPEIGLHDPLADSFSGSREGRLLFWLAVAFSAFQLATALGLLVLPSQIVRAVHVGFLTLLVFPLIGVARHASLPVKLLGWILGLIGAAIAAYQWIFYDDLIIRAGYPTVLDLVVGTALIAVVLLAALQVMGPALPI